MESGRKTAEGDTHPPIVQNVDEWAMGGVQHLYVDAELLQIFKGGWQSKCQEVLLYIVLNQVPLELTGPLSLPWNLLPSVPAASNPPSSFINPDTENEVDLLSQWPLIFLSGVIWMEHFPGSVSVNANSQDPKYVAAVSFLTG